MYELHPLAKILDKYVNYSKLNLAATKEELLDVLRLVITAVNVMTAKPLVFDNTKMRIEAKHILASAGYPLCGLPWIEIEDGVSSSDGSLLSNTPAREVLYVSPKMIRTSSSSKIILERLRTYLPTLRKLKAEQKTFYLVTKMKTREKCQILSQGKLDL